MLIQYMDSKTMSEMILKATEIEYRSKSLRQFIENYIRFCFKGNFLSGVWAPRPWSVSLFNRSETHVSRVSPGQHHTLTPIGIKGDWVF